MDGVFMRKLWNRVLIIVLLTGCFGIGGLLADKQQLSNEMIRFHVVANSDTAEDQAMKLEVRDAVLASLRDGLESCRDQEAARAYLKTNLPKIESVANEVLRTYGMDFTAVATLCKETFDVRYYDSFTLPSGVYESLRIRIGKAEGKNWWCVVFPSFCLPAATESFSDIAVGAGFSDDLIHTLEGKEDYKIRFFLLDLLGKVENIFADDSI